MSLEIWNKFSKPPITALKTIQAGRLKGKSDINPQWRYQALTEVFGPCGLGWKYTIDKLWTVPQEREVFTFADVSLYVKIEGEWSDAIPGNGGSMLVKMESGGLHLNDEGFKMAITDALGTAAKMLGVAAEIYLGNFDGSKYKDETPKEVAKGNIGETADDILAAAKAAQAKAAYQTGNKPQMKNPGARISEGQNRAIHAICNKLGIGRDDVIIEINGILRGDNPFGEYHAKGSTTELTMSEAGIVIEALQARQKEAHR